MGKASKVNTFSTTDLEIRNDNIGAPSDPIDKSALFFIPIWTDQHQRREKNLH